ncbi:sugar O-acetyltransferase [Tellurirhabdus rosea]|uniref:sugar O-acetyltransferase n=1 Tax=Tellurirhabdus rosea TaxID=2674997 RepID=UPI0022545853|nr:sugar O-acetyltransferase [Tellurirhabdus rosea]
MPDESATADIFQRLQAGEPLRRDDPEYPKFGEAVAHTIRLCVEMNAAATDVDAVRARLSVIIGTEIDASTTIFPPFYTNFGRFTRLGKNIFINHDCSFVDIGGITVEDDVLIGPKVSLITENHPLDPADRKTLLLKPIVIRRNAWIGAGATILPGVTVGENSVVAAGAVVNRDVPPNTVVAGVPAKVVRTL